jgi:protein-disulfide isomerase
MGMDKARLSDIGTWVVVVCALLSTILVVRREFSQGSTVTGEATYVEDWQEAFAVGIRSGSPSAPVQIVEFADFECPFCAQFEATVRAVHDKYQDQVAFTFAHFPLAMHSFAEPAARAAECADLQGRFQVVRTALFQRQRTFGSVPWTDLAKQAGIPDVEQFDKCVADTRPLERIEQGKRLGQKLGILGTPTIIVNGWKLPVPPSLEDLQKIVENVLKGRPPAEDIEFIVATRVRN